MNVTLVRADSLQYMLKHANSEYDMVIADPPYSSGGMTSSERMGTTKSKYLSAESGNHAKLLNFQGDNRDQRSYLTWSYMWMSAAKDLMKDGALMLTFSDWRQLPITTDAMQCAGLIWRGIIPWHKPTARPQRDRYSSACEYIVWGTKGQRDTRAPNAKCVSGFYEHRPPTNRIHVTEKPVELYEHIYRLLKDGSKVLDPFAGSATSAIAALKSNIEYVGLELDPGIYKVASDRLKEHRKLLAK